MPKLKRKNDSMWLWQRLYQSLFIWRTEFLTDLPPVYWQDAVRHMKRPYLNYWLSDAVYAQIINSDPDTCEFELRYSPAEFNKERLEVVILRGSMTYDSAFYGGRVELDSELNPLPLLMLSLFLLFFIPYFACAATLIFSFAFIIDSTGWLFILPYLLIISALWGFHWNKPGQLIQIVKAELDTEAFFMANPDLRKKK